MKWTEPFVNLFQKDSTIKMVGVSINMLVRRFSPHVQSYFFMIENNALNYVKSTGLFDKNFSEIIDVVYQQEIELSLALLRNGWNISCMVPEFQNIYYQELIKQMNENGFYSLISINNRKYISGVTDEVIFTGKRCFGRDLHPYELIFMKTDNELRKLSIDEINSLTNYFTWW
jgi:hypothetical protein